MRRVATVSGSGLTSGALVESAEADTVRRDAGAFAAAATSSIATRT